MIEMQYPNFDVFSLHYIKFLRYPDHNILTLLVSLEVFDPMLEMQYPNFDGLLIIM